LIFLLFPSILLAQNRRTKMRHIQIPDPVVLLMVVDEKGNPVLYDLKRLNMANVWNSSKWRDENKIEMCMRIADKFEATKYVPGTWVSLTDEEYEPRDGT
jgi:hypothetical protein